MKKKTYFNYRLSRARVIENAFGILTARWRILKTILNMKASNADKIVKATVVLHNFIKINDPGYCPPNYVDHVVNGVEVRGLWRQDTTSLKNIAHLSSNFSPRNAFHMRDCLKEYLYNNKI